jgi:hypothetical protein
MSFEEDQSLTFPGLYAPAKFENNLVIHRNNPGGSALL